MNSEKVIFTEQEIKNCKGMPLRITGAVRLKIERLGWLDEFKPYFKQSNVPTIDWNCAIEIAIKCGINIHESWSGAEFVEQEISVKDENVIIAIYKVFLMLEVAE
jgi:hypothetical protein